MEIDKSELITEPLPKPLESEYVRTLIREVCYRANWLGLFLAKIALN